MPSVRSADRKPSYLSRYTHRVAISNRRLSLCLVAADDGGVSFRWEDYRIEGPGRWKTMTLTPHEFRGRDFTPVFTRPAPRPELRSSFYIAAFSDTNSTDCLCRDSCVSLHVTAL
jgi:putative transposase